MKRPDAARALASLERVTRRQATASMTRQREWLTVLASKPLQGKSRLLRLHELLCFLEAYPADRRMHAGVQRMLRAFRDRPDLQPYRAALAGSGIAGTDTPYRFYWPTARWISERWPGALAIDRDDPEQMQATLDALPRLLDPLRADWLRRQKSPTVRVLDRLRPKGVRDADFLIGLVASLPCDEMEREAFFDRLDPPFVLRAGRDTPERTTARFNRLPLHFAAQTPTPGRSDIRREAERPPRRVIPLRGTDARDLVTLARVSMITRERDLAVFQYANARDAFLVDDGQGLAFGLVGALPERRALLPATYGGMTLQNGVPIGYVQLDVLGRHAELSFNTFPGFRGAQASRVFARLIAATHHVFGCDGFSIEPYQLGLGNDEGIESGAWWFYQRHGFRPRARAAVALAARELARQRRRPGYRSSARTLRALSRFHLYFALDAARPARLPRIAPWLKAANRDRSTAAAGNLQEPWAALVLALTHGRSWNAQERRDLLRLAAAKSGPNEREFQRAVLRHRRFRALLGC